MSNQCRSRDGTPLGPDATDGRRVGVPHVSVLHVGLFFFAGAPSFALLFLAKGGSVYSSPQPIQNEELKFTIDKHTERIVAFRVLSRTNLVHRFRPSSLNPCAVNLLQPLDSLFPTPLLCFQQLAASFCKTPGLGVPFGLRPTSNIQPLTHVFVRHMRHVAPLSPVPSLDCAYFLSPRVYPSQHSNLQTFGRSDAPMLLFSSAFRNFATFGGIQSSEASFVAQRHHRVDPGRGARGRRRRPGLPAQAARLGETPGDMLRTEEKRLAESFLFCCGAGAFAVFTEPKRNRRRGRFGQSDRSDLLSARG